VRKHRPGFDFLLCQNTSFPLQLAPMHALLAFAMTPATLMLLAILGFTAFVFLMMFGINFFSRKMSGWPAITDKFPMVDNVENGDSYARQSGTAGNIECKRGFNINLTKQGICLFPTFARRNPCLIPWSAIRQVSVKKTGLVITVDYEKPFEFFLPPQALPTFKDRVAPQIIS